MLFRLTPLPSLTALAISGLILVDSPRAIAHQVQTSADIGSTVHIEPNDTPRAGEPTLAWFALTRRGGTSVPLSDCNCQLSIYRAGETGEAIATPSLAPLSIEGYENIPSATVMFPEVGRYELVMTGTPANGEDFQPFELRFPVTVATAAPAAAQMAPSAKVPASEAPSANDSPAPRVAIALVLMIIAGLGVFLLVLRQAKPSQKDSDSEL